MVEHATIILIPARLRSQRLPNKPLAEIGGVPMIVQVWRRACEAEVGPVIVACAEPEIAAAVEAHGGQATLTDPELPSGTDRIFQALRQVDPGRRFEHVINLQGDLPTLDPGAIRAALEPIERLGTDLGTLATPIADPEERDDPNVVKPVIAIDRDNPKGQGGMGWNSGYTVKARIDRDRKIWYGEMRIPIAAIDERTTPIRGRAFRVGFFRIAGVTDKQHYAWRPTGRTSFHVPAAFGQLILR